MNTRVAPSADKVMTRSTSVGTNAAENFEDMKMQCCLYKLWTNADHLTLLDPSPIVPTQKTRPHYERQTMRKTCFGARYHGGIMGTNAVQSDRK